MTIRSETICICIAAYNAEATVARAVASALCQEHVSEVIVVDDGSADLTANAARQCDDGSGRLKVIVLEQNSGPSAARNEALAQSSADIFCVLDADDYLLPERTSRLVAFDHGDWDLLADDILIIPQGLAEDERTELLDVPPRVLAELDVPTFVLGNISRLGRERRELGFLKPLIRRRFVEAQSLRYETSMRLGEDYALYVQALMRGAKFKVADFCGYVAVERANSLSSKHSASDLNAICAFDAACLEVTSLSDAARQALAAHQRATTRKWALARALEVRRQQGIGEALRFLAKQPRSARYVASEIFRAKSTSIRRRLWSENEIQQPRRLIGQGPIDIG